MFADCEAVLHRKLVGVSTSAIRSRFSPLIVGGIDPLGLGLDDLFVDGPIPIAVEEI